MNILSVNSGLDQAFVDMGHRVCAVHPSGGMLDVADELEARRFVPDLIFQQESLGTRVFLRQLERVRCPKIFWALDSHLNIHWHKYYFRLFDAICTPHLSFHELMPDAWAPKKIVRLPLSGRDWPWRPHSERTQEMAFVGLDAPQARPIRSHFFGILRPLGLTPISGVDSQGMQAAYCNARVVPNESIGFEVNFRLTEAASAGACILTPAVGPDQDWLYEPDREMLVYENGLDLVEKVNFLRRKPDIGEKLGRAAWERTRKSHLPCCRAADVVALAEELCGNPSDPVFLHMALAQRGRHAGEAPPTVLLEELAASDIPAAPALCLRCLSEFQTGEETEREVRLQLMQPGVEQDKDMLFAVLGHALLHEDLALFQAGWGIWLRTRPDRLSESPKSLYSACLLLAHALREDGRRFQPGFAFDAARMTPETALEALLMAKRHADGDIVWADQLAKLTVRHKMWTLMRVDALTAMAEHGTGNLWRTLLERGFARLIACDLEGLADLRAAEALAAQAGKSALFQSVLAGHGIDPLVVQTIRI